MVALGGSTLTEQTAAARNHVVSFHYELADEAGRIVESSNDGDPTLALLGHQNLMPGLDEALLGRVAGESFSTTLEPDQAFGLRREDWIQRVSKKQFPKGTRFGVLIVESIKPPFYGDVMLLLCR